MNKQEVNIQIHPSIVKLKEKIEALKEEVATLFSEREILLKTVGPNLEAMYDVKIGKKEYELFCVECSIKRLKRKIEILQAASNREESICDEEVEKKLDEEFKEWQKEMEQIYNSIKDSEKHLSSLMSYEDSMEIKKLYKLLVKKLHPDINHNLSEKEKALWFRVNEAYQQSDLEELRTLAIIVNDEKIKEVKEVSNIDEINNMIKKLSEKIVTLTEAIKSIKSQFPFEYEELLEDDQWVAACNEEIQKNIDELNNRKKYLQDMINIMSLPQSDMLN